MELVWYLPFVFFPLVLAYAAASDLLTMTIPNWVSVALVAGFAVLAPLAGMDWQTVGLNVVAAIIVLAIAFACFAMGWVGGGDAKFATAIVLWLGWQHALPFVVYSAIFGGSLTFLILAFRHYALPLFAMRQDWIQRLHDSKAGVPYGLALAAAALMIYPKTVWMQFLAG